MADGFTRRKEHSKEEVRRAAWELFSQLGVEKVSVIDIARKAGVSHATIYNNFGSKEALARAFVADAIDGLVGGMEQVLAPQKDFWEKMRDFVGFISRMMAQGPSGAGAVAFGGTDAFSASYALLNDPQIQTIRAAAQEKMIALLLGLVQEGKAQGHVRADLRDDALRAYFTAFMEVFPSPQFRQSCASDPQVLQDLTALMLFGLRGSKVG